MDSMFYPLVFISLFLTLIVLYLMHLNNAMNSTPEEATKISPRRWTAEEIKETYKRVCENPVDYREHLPSKLGRRYIVIGSSG